MIIGNKIHIGSRRKVTIGSKLNYSSAEVDTYMEGLTTPLSSSQEEKLRTLVVDLKRGLHIKNLADAFDVMYILAGETDESSLRNLVKNAHHATAVNSPTFTALEGFKGNGTSSYLNSNYNPSSMGLRYTLNEASFGAYMRTAVAGSIQSAIGCRQSTSYYSTLFFNAYGTASTINQDASNTLIATFSKLGLCVVNRVDSGNTSFFHNNQIIANVAKIANGIPNANFFILARNSDGTAEQHTSVQVSFAFASKYLNPTQLQVLSNAIEAYMDSNGKGVIS